MENLSERDEQLFKVICECMKPPIETKEEIESFRNSQLAEFMLNDIKLVYEKLDGFVEALIKIVRVCEDYKKE